MNVKPNLVNSIINTLVLLVAIFYFNACSDDFIADYEIQYELSVNSTLVVGKNEQYISIVRVMLGDYGFYRLY